MEAVRRRKHDSGFRKQAVKPCLEDGKTVSWGCRPSWYYQDLPYHFLRYVEVYYNRRGRHSDNGWKSPAQHEADWYEMRKAA
jgi:transposase InsO family protein